MKSILLILHPKSITASGVCLRQSTVPASGNTARQTQWVTSMPAQSVRTGPTAVAANFVKTVLGTTTTTPRAISS